MNLEVTKLRLIARAREVVTQSIANRDGPADSSPKAADEYRISKELANLHLIARAREAVQSIKKRDFPSYVSNLTASPQSEDGAHEIDELDPTQLQQHIFKLQNMTCSLQEENDELRDQCQSQRNLLTELSKLITSGCDESALKEIDYLPGETVLSADAALDLTFGKLQLQAEQLEKERDQLVLKVKELEVKMKELEDEVAMKDSKIQALEAAAQQNNTLPEEAVHISKTAAEEEDTIIIIPTEVPPAASSLAGDDFDSVGENPHSLGTPSELETSDVEPLSTAGSGELESGADLLCNSMSLDLESTTCSENSHDSSELPSERERSHAPSEHAAAVPVDYPQNESMLNHKPEIKTQPPHSRAPGIVSKMRFL